MSVSNEKQLQRAKPIVNSKPNGMIYYKILDLQSIPINFNDSMTHIISDVEQKETNQSKAK